MGFVGGAPILSGPWDACLGEPLVRDEEEDDDADDDADDRDARTLREARMHSLPSAQSLRFGTILDVASLLPFYVLCQDFLLAALLATSSCCYVSNLPQH